MENIRVNESGHEIILSGPHCEDVTSYFLEEVNSGEDMTSDILTLALREASQDTCNSMEHIGNNYDPMGEVSVSLVQSRNVNMNDTSERSNAVQGKFTTLSLRPSCDTDLSAALTQCDSDAILNENSCYFTIESNGVANSVCNNSGNSLSIGIEQLVNSLNNFDSCQMENRQALVASSQPEVENNDINETNNDGVTSLKMDNGNELPSEKYFQDSLLTQSDNITENRNIQNSQDNESSLPVSSELGHLPSPGLNNSTINTQNLVESNPPKNTASNSILPKANYVADNLKPTSLVPTTTCIIPTISSESIIKTYIPIQAAPQVKINSLVPPLGSSNNPIQVIQHGNTYHSTQALSDEQLQQIALVLQQQQQQHATKTTDNNGAVLYNPDTNTRIIYRVVYPADAKQLETRENANGGFKTFPGGVNKSRGRPRKTWTKKPEPDVPRADGQELSKEEKEEKKKHRPRTRYGRISKPPSYMIKDYKRIHHLDFDQEPYDDSDGGYSDFQQSEDEGDLTSERRSRVSNCTIALGKEMKRILPPGVTTIKPRNYKCATCDKAYIGKGGLERHFRLAPGHGSIEDFEDTTHEVFSDDNSNASGGSQGSNEENGKVNSAGNDNVPNQNIPLSNHSNDDSINTKKNRHTVFSSGYYARRKAKLKDLIQPYQDDELLELLLPRLSKLVNLWDFLLLKSERGNPAEPDIPDIFKQFEELVLRLQVVCRDCLVLSSTGLTNPSYNRGNKEGETSGEDSKLYVEVASDRVASALGITIGLYEVKQKELLELVPSFLKPTRKRKSDYCSSSEKENSAFSKDIPKKLCSKNVGDSVLSEEERNYSPGLNFITSTARILTSRDSLADLSIPDPILTHSVSMMDENNFHLDEIEENTTNSNMTSHLTNKNQLSSPVSDPSLTTSLPLDQNDKTLTRSDRNMSDTNANPSCSSTNTLMNKTPSIGNTLLPSLSLETSLLFSTMSLSPSSLVTDVKSSNLFQVKKVNLFGSPVNRDNYLTLENSQDSLSDPTSKDQAKVDNLECTYTLTHIQDRPSSLLDVPHPESDNNKSTTDISQSSVASDSDVSMVTVPKPANSAIESYIISENETPCLFSQTNESGNITLFKGDCQGNDTNTSMLMDFNSKSNEITQTDFHEMVVDLENESGDNNCLVGLLVNSNDEKMKEDMRDNELGDMNLDDMNEGVTNMFDEKHSSENEIEKHEDIENSFLPGNVIIVQNPDGTTTLQVPGNQVFSLEALQALFGFEQASPLSSSSETFGNSITLNSQLSDISGHDGGLLENINS